MYTGTNPPYIYMSVAAAPLSELSYVPVAALIVAVPLPVAVPAPVATFKSIFERIVRELCGETQDENHVLLHVPKEEVRPCDSLSRIDQLVAVLMLAIRDSIDQALRQ